MAIQIYASQTCKRITWSFHVLSMPGKHKAICMQNICAQLLHEGGIRLYTVVGGARCYYSIGSINKRMYSFALQSYFFKTRSIGSFGILASCLMTLLDAWSKGCLREMLQLKMSSLVNQEMQIWRGEEIDLNERRQFCKYAGTICIKDLKLQHIDIKSRDVLVFSSSTF